mmetsp:Transcript_91477/g.222132  ORF Transcript_91477/g.222132 Transcript_91477/m.222132 type:complete len:433 (+) Transcript_91477:50-1348(+)
MANAKTVRSSGDSPPSSGKRAPLAKVDPRGPFSAAIVVGAFAALTLAAEPAKPGSALPWTLNPTGYLHGVWYVLLYALTIPAKELMNALLGLAGSVVFGFKRMDEGEGAVRKLEVLEAIDLCYLALNTMVEFIGMNHIVAFLLAGSPEPRLSSFGVLNGPVAFVTVMCINDIIYYPFHLIAHKREFYPYCHKQHHRQFVPFRGYADAANQHPLEQAYGFSIFIASMHLTSKFVGLHASAAWCCFITWAVLNIANHLAFDSKIHLPVPYPAFPRDHQMHHRFPQCNYSTLTSFCDRVFGTFKPYRELGVPITREEPAGKSDSKEQGNQRPEAVPSAYSVAVLGLALMAAAVAVEALQLGGLPEVVELVSLVKPAIVIANVAAVCAAAEASGTSSSGVSPDNTRTSKLVEAVPTGGYKSLQGVQKAEKKPFKAE